MKEQTINIIIEGEIDMDSLEDLFYTTLLSRVLELRLKKQNVEKPKDD